MSKVPPQHPGTCLYGCAWGVPFLVFRSSLGGDVSCWTRCLRIRHVIRGLHWLQYELLATDGCKTPGVAAIGVPSELIGCCNIDGSNRQQMETFLDDRHGIRRTYHRTSAMVLVEATEVDASWFHLVWRCNAWITRRVACPAGMAATHPSSCSHSGHARIRTMAADRRVGSTSSWLLLRSTAPFLATVRRRSSHDIVVGVPTTWVSLLSTTLIPGLFLPGFLSRHLGSWIDRSHPSDAHRDLLHADRNLFQ